MSLLHLLKKTLVDTTVGDIAVPKDTLIMISGRDVRLLFNAPLIEGRTRLRCAVWSYALRVVGNHKFYTHAYVCVDITVLA